MQEVNRQKRTASMKRKRMPMLRLTSVQEGSGEREARQQEATRQASRMRLYQHTTLTQKRNTMKSLWLPMPTQLFTHYIQMQCFTFKEKKVMKKRKETTTTKKKKKKK